MSENQEKKTGVWHHALILGAIAVALLVLGLIFRDDIARFTVRLFSGEITKESAKEFMQSFGWRGMVIIPVFSMLQVVLTFLPAEPVQVVAGMSYGLWVGIGLCMAGVFVGNNIMFLLSRTLGVKLTRYFRKNIDIDLTGGAASWRISLAVLILYFLPAIPYGLICFMTASTGMKYPRYIILTTLGSLPSVLIGAALGVIAIETGFLVALITLAVLIVVIIVMFCLRKKIFAAINRAIAKGNEPHTTAHKVNKPNAFIYKSAQVFVGTYLRSKVKIKISNPFKRLPRPAVVLVTHPSFMDWAYAALALKKDLGNFIIARYYYFHKKLAWLVKKVGTLPKSMFTTDIESARNAFRVIKNGGLLCLMPEARLSTAGKTEQINHMSAKKLKTLGAPVYTVHIDGAYLAKPKWGRGFRKGAVVEARVGKLFDSERLMQMSEAEVVGEIEKAMNYNDFRWLSKHPEIKYKSKRIAEGMENILSRCPDCGEEFSLKSCGNSLYCEKCGFKAAVDERYAFRREGGSGGELPENLQQWYERDEAQLREEIIADAEYVLKDKVRLKFPDRTGKSFFVEVGEGECTLSREGFSFDGTVNGEPHTLKVKQNEMYRLLFGAGENFEIYYGKDYYYFIPSDVRSCVKWYTASGILNDLTVGNGNG